MKASDTQWTAAHFRPEEFVCAHCGAHGIDIDTVQRLEALRVRLDRPLIITSGYRCAKHPLEAAKPRVGAHAHGRAVDVRCTLSERRVLRKAAISVGFTGIGVARTYMHLDDVQPGEIAAIRRPAEWSYP